MGKILTALAVAMLVVLPAAASDKTDKADVLTVLHEWVDGFNKGGDMKAALATCADEGAVIAGTAPYEWRGEGACSKWFVDYDASMKKQEITDAVAILGKLRDIEITGDHAFVVAPVSFTYKTKGKPMKQTGGIWIVALHKGASGWRISGWSFAAGKESPAEAASGK